MGGYVVCPSTGLERDGVQLESACNRTLVNCVCSPTFLDAIERRVSAIGRRVEKVLSRLLQDLERRPAPIQLSRLNPFRFRLCRMRRHVIPLPRWTLPECDFVKGRNRNERALLSGIDAGLGFHVNRDRRRCNRPRSGPFHRFWFIVPFIWSSQRYEPVYPPPSLLVPTLESLNMVQLDDTFGAWCDFLLSHLIISS